jgi:hypothetical protein
LSDGTRLAPAECCSVPRITVQKKTEGDGREDAREGERKGARGRESERVDERRSKSERVDERRSEKATGIIHTPSRHAGKKEGQTDTGMRMRLGTAALCISLDRVWRFGSYLHARGGDIPHC